MGPVKYNFGVELNEETRREFSRHPVLISALLDTGKYEFKCHVYDLSLKGVRLRLDLPLQVGFECLVSIKGTPYLPTQVMWTDNNYIGLEFIPSSKWVVMVFGGPCRTFAGRMKFY